MRGRAEKIEELKKYLEGHEGVVMAFLFGSQAKGYARTNSDWDIGVYFSQEKPALETEVWSQIEKITGAETDMVALNRAPAILAWSIVRGQPLVLKDRNAYLDFLTQTSHEANDWHETSEDYHKVFERSSSLSREDRGRLEKIAQFLSIESSDFSRFEKLSWEEYSSDRDQKRLVERWIEQIVNAVIDVSEIILASEKKVIPETYREMVRTLGVVAPFDKNDTCLKLSDLTPLRNILAHQYLDYRWKNIARFIQEAKPLAADFISSVGVFLRAPQD